MFKFVSKVNFLNKNKGFTLFELLLVISIVVVISSVGVGFYLNYSRSVELNSATATILSNIKQAQSKSIVGEGGFKWGVHFVNSTSSYYEIFSSPTDYSDASKVVISKNYLPGSISFYDPVINTTKDIIFNKISGSTTASSISLFYGGNAKMISVTSLGTISSSDVVFYLINVSKAGAGTGAVTSSPLGINCGSTCSYGYNTGTSVTLTATPISGTFFSWGGCDSTNGADCTVALSSTRNLTATFAAPVYNLSVSNPGTGTGTITSSPAGINCGSTCSYGYTSGTSVTLTETTTWGTFTGWSGGGCSGTGPTCTVVMSQAYSVSATVAAPACSGTMYGGYCWYSGSNDTPCITTCSSHGGCIDASIDYGTEVGVCNTLWPATGSSIAAVSGTASPAVDGANWCYIQNNPNNLSVSLTEDTCSSYSQWHANACSCVR
jgi:prepilin-type N-terminal cleavage/methylation domain-containing protein